MCANKLDTLDEMDKSLKTDSTKTKSQSDRYLDKPVASKEIESVIKKSPDKKRLGYIAEFYQTFK